jgi:hypothetical protein
MAEDKKVRRPASQRAVDLLGNMRLREMKTFAADLRRDEPVTFAALLGYMQQEETTADLEDIQDARLRGDEKNPTATEIEIARQAGAPCLGCRQGYKVCAAWRPDVVPDRCSQCHHSYGCHS